ncbi:MAG: GDP-mannose 4,6-dehydratase, partial [Anaerolineales bacterium]
AEAMTMAYYRYHNLDTKIVRIFNTYGPRMRLDDGRVVPNFIGQALRGEPLTIYGDGSQTRSFCYVDDLVDGICRLLLSNEHDPVNIGNPVEISIREFAERIGAMFQPPSPITVQIERRGVGDPQRRQPDITRAQTVLGWSPKVPLDEGLARTVRYFQTKIPKLRS